MNSDVQAQILGGSTRNRIQREQYGNPKNPDLIIHQIKGQTFDIISKEIG
jgi:hypothetical protein